MINFCNFKSLFQFLQYSPSTLLKNTCFKNDLIDLIEENSSSSVSIPPIAYASNSEAVAALGVGVIYKTTTVLADGVSPILSITV